MQLATLEQLSAVLCLVSWDQLMVPQLHQLQDPGELVLCSIVIRLV